MSQGPSSLLAGLRGGLAALALLAGAAGAADSTPPPQFVVDGKPLQTQPADAALVLPLVDGLLAYGDAVAASGGKPPKDAKARLEKLRTQAAKATPELTAMAKRLQAAREAAAFNRYMAQEVTAAKAPALAAQFKSFDGDAYTVLLKSEQHLGSVLAQLQQELSARDSERLFALLGIGSAEAGLGCSLVHFAVWAAAKAAGSRRSAEKIEDKNRRDCIDR